jgi:hypothetical protein
MTRLAHLAPEPFNQIISQLNTLELTALWLCGDLKLNWRLSKGKAAQTVAIRWSDHSTSLFPSFLAELDGLQAFSLMDHSFSRRNRLTWRHLVMLNRNVRFLQIRADSSMSAFAKLWSMYPQRFPYLETMSILYHIVNTQLNIVIPNTVTDLEIFSFANMGADKVTGTPMSLNWLPNSLTKLHYEGDFFTRDGCRFPPKLRGLKIHTNFIS